MLIVRCRGKSNVVVAGALSSRPYGTRNLEPKSPGLSQTQDNGRVAARPHATRLRAQAETETEHEHDSADETVAADNIGDAHG